MPTAAITPTYLTITPPPSLQSSGRTQLSATVGFSDNTSKTVTPLWSSSDPSVATVSSSGLLVAGSVLTDTQVTLTASYTENGQKVEASKIITITAAPAALSSLSISGGNTVSASGLLRLAASATYADGSSRSVAGITWTASAGSINSRGELTAPAVTSDTAITISASYSEGGVSKTTTTTLTVKASPSTLTSLTIVGAQGTLAAGSSLTLAAESGYSDGSGKRISATWSISNTVAASISASGVVTAKTVTEDTPVIITASYTEGGTTATAKYSVIVQATTTTPQLTAEVIATVNTQNLAKLQLWFNSDTQATVRSNRSASKFKVYVAAVLPVGALVSAPTYFLLNRSKEWQALSWPLAEYLSGVNAGEWHLIELLDGVDLSLIAGAQILVGYGENETDMLENQRYRMVYQVP